MDPKVETPDEGEKVRAVLLVALVLALGALAFVLVDRYLDGIGTRLHREEPERVAHQLAATLRLVAAGLALLVLIMAGWLFRFARKISKSGRFPPPGSRVIYDTPVITGAAARHKAYIGYTLSAILFFAGVVATVLLWRVTDSLLAL
jgi:hypothetical protein